MKRRLAGFNFYLLLLATLLIVGCQTTKKTPEQKADAKKHKKERTLIYFFLETNAGGNQANAVPIYRKEPIYVAVQAASFLDLGNVADAAVLEYQEGFAIQVRFDAHGALVLETTTGSNKGRRIAVMSKLHPEGETRWLGAPMIQQRNATGVLTFTPDATRDECVRIVRGITNSVAELKHKEKF